MLHTIRTNYQDEEQQKELSECEWEERLQIHYLSANGPYGCSRLTYLNVSPSEIRAAAKLNNLTEEEVVRQFINLFSTSKVRSVFGSKAPYDKTSFMESKFRYLVLSCLVESIFGDKISSTIYVDKVAELLNEPKQLSQSDCKNINKAWQTFAHAQNSKNVSDNNYRYIDLPSPGGWTNIGIATKLAYPSRGDRSQLKKVLKKLSNLETSRPALLITSLLHHKHDLPLVMQQEIVDLDNVYRKHPVIGARHRFWFFLESVLEELSGVDTGINKKLHWKMTVSFSGFDNDRLYINVYAAIKSSDVSKSIWEGSFNEWLNTTEELPNCLIRMKNNGILILASDCQGNWEVGSTIANLKNKQCIILTNKTEIAANFTTSFDIGERWFVSSPIEYVKANSLISGLLYDIETPQEALFTVEGGILLRKNCWLGRRSYLPHIIVPDTATIMAIPLGDSKQLKLERQDGKFNISSDDAALHGKWQIVINLDNHEERYSFEIIPFSDIASKWSSISKNFEEIPELIYRAVNLSTDKSAVIEANNSDELPVPISDFIEALYAHASKHLSDSQLLELIKSAFEKEINPWDIIRSYEEGGFLHQSISKNWCGRQWRVLPPLIIRIDQHLAMVEGTVAERELASLRSSAKLLSVEVHILCEHKFSAPLFILSGQNIMQLASKLKWPITPVFMPDISLARFRNSAYSDSGRQLSGIWNGRLFDAHIKENGSEIQLKRYTRKDQRDVYAVTSSGDAFFSESRITAIIEYNRQKGSSPFSFNRDTIHSSSGVYLPLPIAKWLRRTNCRQVESLDHNSYLYAASMKQFQFIQLKLGLMAQFNSSSKKAIQKIAMHRHRKRIS